MALGGEPELARPLPRRPKGMWQRSYKRWIEKNLATDEEAKAAFFIGKHHFLDRIGSLGR